MFTFLKSDVAFKKIKTNQSVHQWGIGLQIIVNPYNFKNEKSKVQPFSLSLSLYIHTHVYAFSAYAYNISGVDTCGDCAPTSRDHWASPTNPRA